MVKFGSNEIRTLRLGESFVLKCITKRDVRRVQANISYWRTQYPGCEIKTSAVDAYMKNPDGSESQRVGYYDLSIERLKLGVNIDTGAQEPTTI